jgi:hypothetical protein
MSFAPGQDNSPNYPWASASQANTSSHQGAVYPTTTASSNAATMTATTMALAAAASTLDPCSQPSILQRPPILFQSNERTARTVTGAHCSSQFAHDPLQVSSPPWLSEPGILQVPPRPHSGPSIHSTQMPQRTPSFHSAPDTFPHQHIARPLHRISSQSHSPQTSSPSPQRATPPAPQSFHSSSLHPTAGQGGPHSSHMHPVRHHSSPPDQPPFQWARTSHPSTHWPLEPAVSPRTAAGGLSMAPVASVATGSHTDDPRTWGSAPLPAEMNWFTAQSVHGPHFPPSSNVRPRPGPVPVAAFCYGVILRELECCLLLWSHLASVPRSQPSSFSSLH